MKKRIVFILCLIISIFIVSRLIPGPELYLSEATRFIKEDALVQSKVGEVNSFSHKRTMRSKAYHEYQFLVGGPRGKVRVEIRVSHPDDPSKRNFSITSIMDRWGREV